MCGIVGYIGPSSVTKALLEALGRLEYRGYDSAGVAVINGRGLEVRKRAGKLTVLEDTLRKRPIAGQIGVGHVCSPNHLHREMVKAALAAGKHVVCEKPLALTVSEADELVELAQEKRLGSAFLPE